jgi:hypothetical protein
VKRVAKKIAAGAGLHLTGGWAIYTPFLEIECILYGLCSPILADGLVDAEVVAASGACSGGVIREKLGALVGDVVVEGGSTRLDADVRSSGVVSVTRRRMN